MIYLYRITNIINNKVYVGQSASKTRRWNQHKYFSKTPEKTGQYIHHAINKHGIENFKYEIIVTCLTCDDANFIEEILINQYDSRNKQHGYNIAPGGGAGWNRGLPKEQQPMFGKKQSEFFKKKMSEIHKGKKVVHSKKWKQHQSKILTGHLVSNETRNKISAALKGKVVTQESKNKMSFSKKGRRLSEETKQKLSKSLLKLNEKQITDIIIEYKNGVTRNALIKKYKTTYPTLNKILKLK